MFRVHVLCRRYCEFVGRREVFAHRSGHSLDDRRDPLTAADAERREPVALLTLAELVGEREREARARRAERVPERDRAAVHVRLLAIEAAVPLHRGVLRREGRVDLDAIHALDLDAVALARLARSWRRSADRDARVQAAQASG